MKNKEVEIFKIFVEPHGSRIIRYAAEERAKTYLVRESSDRVIKKSELEVVKEGWLYDSKVAYTLDKNKVKQLYSEVRMAALQRQEALIIKSQKAVDDILNKPIETLDKFDWRK